MSRDQDQGCRLYLITPPSIDLETFKAAFAEALAADQDGLIAALQIRLKDAPDNEIRAAALALKPLCDGHGAALIMNDRPDLASQTRCHGVHIGQEDASYEEAREAVGDNGIVGVTCHDSRHLAMLASEQGADYVAFGAFFPTTTKQAKHAADPEILEAWSTVTVVPCVAIGGITPENCGSLVAAGTDYLAVVSSVWDHPEGPGAAVRAFAAAIAATRP